MGDLTCLVYMTLESNMTTYTKQDAVSSNVLIRGLGFTSCQPKAI